MSKDVKLDKDTLIKIVYSKLENGQKFPSGNRAADVRRVLSSNLKKVRDRMRIGTLARLCNEIWGRGKQKARMWVEQVIDDPVASWPFFRMKTDKARVAYVNEELLEEMRQRIADGLPVDDLFNDIDD